APPVTDTAPPVTPEALVLPAMGNGSAEPVMDAGGEGTLPALVRDDPSGRVMAPFALTTRFPTSTVCRNRTTPIPHLHRSSDLQSDLGSDQSFTSCSPG